jgi:hypothetical protein
MKLNIVGTGDTWLQCPHDGLIWCTSTIYEKMDRFGFAPALVWQLHEKNVHEPWLKTLGNRVVVMKEYEHLPEAQVLQREYLAERFGAKFTSSVSWMMARAIAEGFESISFYGIDMNHSSEYKAQRDAFFYFYGRAEERGIEIVIPPRSGAHMPASLYGAKS